MAVKTAEQMAALWAASSAVRKVAYLALNSVEKMVASTAGLSAVWLVLQMAAHWAVLMAGLMVSKKVEQKVAQMAAQMAA